MTHIMIVKHGVRTNYSLTDAVKEIGNLTRLGLPRRKSQSPYSQITNVVPGRFPYEMRRYNQLPYSREKYL